MMMEVDDFLDDGRCDPSNGIAKLTIDGQASEDRDSELTRYVPNFYAEGDKGGEESVQIKGILKSYRKSSINEVAVGKSLALICVESKYDHLQESVEEVFHGLCLDEFFHKGECIDSRCYLSHQYRTFVFREDLKVWNAALFVICYAASPDVRVIKNLVHFFSERRDFVRTLALSKCIAKVKPVEMLDLAHFIVNRLTGIAARRDTVTQILILTYPDLSAPFFNQLVEGLGVFEQNTAHYSDLMSFLCYQGHKLPDKCLVKLMNDSTTFCSEESTLPTSILGFLNNISKKAHDALEPSVSVFLEKFGSLNKKCDVAGKSAAKEVNAFTTKRVQFQIDEEPEVIEDIACDAVLEDEPFEPVQVELPPEKPSLSSAFERRHASLVAVFGDVCYAWLVRSDCSKLVCSQRHDFDVESLSSNSSNDVFVASDFVVEQTICPAMPVLEAFIEYLLMTDEFSRVLSYKKCVPRINPNDGLKLTELILSRLCHLTDPWEALEMLIIPNLLNDEDDNEEQFVFNVILLKTIMVQAAQQKHVLSRLFVHAIIKRYLRLASFEQSSLLQDMTTFINKFLLASRPVIPNILPKPITNTSSFSSLFAYSLSRGGSTQFFVSCSMLKLALDRNLRSVAFDELYKFLLSQYARARILGDMFNSTSFLTHIDRKKTQNVLGHVALALCIHSYENNRYDEVAEVFRVLKNHRMNILSFASKNSISPFDLAVMYCSVTIDHYHEDSIVETFLEHCLQSYLDTATSLATVPNELIKLTDKIFSVLANSSSFEMMLELFNGILNRQKSLVCPLNITYYFEPTLRCSFLHSLNPKIRSAVLKLYLDVDNFDVTIPLQNVTVRSIFLLAAAEVSSSRVEYCLASSAYFRPLMKKLLMKCVKDGAFPRLNGDRIEFLSSMTTTEIKIYLLWWFNLFVRAKKRNSVDYYFRIPVAVVNHIVQDDSSLPVHFSLRRADPSETGCVARLLSVVKSLVDEPLSPSMFKRVKRGSYEFCPQLARNIAHIAIRSMIHNRQIKTICKQLCSFCFDEKDDFELVPI